MPWQQLVADVGAEYDPATGVPFYREVVVTVPRQSGKTTLVLAFEVQRATAWGRSQRMAYTAQTGFDARKKLVDDQAPIVMRSSVKSLVDRVLRAAGQEAIIFKGGSRIEVMATSDAAGHGRTLDLGVIDEAFADTDARREQAILPAMATRRDAQILVVSTAGTDESVYLRRKVDMGRRSATEDPGSGIAYFEWSAPDEADPDDEAVWWACMPALGHTIDVSVVRHARATMTDGEFRRAYLNQWTTSDDRVIPAATWDLVNAPDVRPVGDVTFGVDVNPERSAAAIVAAGGGAVEVIEHRPGVGWLLERCKELDVRWGSPGWVVDGSASSPAASLVPDIERAGLMVREVKGAELARACGQFYDDVVEQCIQIRRHPSLDAAVAGADQRTVGDAWTWARRGTVDISPLVACTVAWWVQKDDYDVLDSVR
jgi:hypothetical protein